MKKNPKEKNQRARRTTITVPAPLKARMDAVEQEINWSRLACEAFEKKLDEIAAEDRDQQSLNDVVARLRHSKRETVDKKYEQGCRAGQSWARKRANYEILHWLAQKAPDMTNFEWGELAKGKKHATVADRFLLHLDPHRFAQQDERDGFWTWVGVGEDSLASVSYVRGVFHGAMEVWEAVKPELDVE